MVRGERLRGFRRRDDLQAQVGHRAKLPCLCPPQRPGTAAMLDAESYEWSAPIYLWQSLRVMRGRYAVARTQLFGQFQYLIPEQCKVVD